MQNLPWLLWLCTKHIVFLGYGVRFCLWTSGPRAIISASGVQHVGWSSGRAGSGARTYVIQRKQQLQCALSYCSSCFTLITHPTAASVAAMTQSTTTAPQQKPFVATRNVRRVATRRRAATSVASFTCDQCGDDFTRGFNFKSALPLFSFLYANLTD